jgi:hypothetical protein
MVAHLYQPVTRRRSKALVVGAAVVAAVASAAACSSSAKTTPLGAGGTSPTSSTSTAVTTTTVVPAVAAILAAYRASWSDYLAVVTQFPVHPTDPRLGSHTTGVELDTIHINLTRAALTAEYAVGTIDLSPVVTAVNASTATVNDCYFDHTKIVNGKTGATVSTGDTERTLINATMTLDAGIWKMANYQKVGSGCTPAG